MKTLFLLFFLVACASNQSANDYVIEVMQPTRYEIPDHAKNGKLNADTGKQKSNKKNNSRSFK
jgi:hypothetical protein